MVGAAVVDEAPGTATDQARSPRTSSSHPATDKGLTLWTWSEIMEDKNDKGQPENFATVLEIARWAKSHLMRPHPELGRVGDVCPFTQQASRINAIRIGACSAGPAEADRILREMEGAVRAFDKIPYPKKMNQFRAVLVGFPNCSDAEGLKVVKQTQDRLSYHSVWMGKMVGFFQPNAQEKGLINPEFRPMRAPLTMLAIRAMVENDAAFVVRNRRLTPIYLAKFPLSGPRLLMAAHAKAAVADA